MIRELQPKTTVFLCTVNWWQAVDPKPYFTEPGDHAGELETSILLHYTPALVRPLGEAGDGRERKFTVPGLRERWVWAQREWTRVTTDTGVGNPKDATAEKGAKFAAAVTEKIGLGATYSVSHQHPFHAARLWAISNQFIRYLA
jgi:creatinine amidohydrolase